MVDGIFENDEILIIECNYSDNPWFWDTPLPSAMEQMKRTDYDRYRWIWMGAFNKRSDEQVFGGKWRIDNFEVKPEWHGPYFGMDFGFPRILPRWLRFISKNCPAGVANIYINRECGKVGLDYRYTSCDGAIIPDG